MNHCNGLFPPMETETDPCTESFPDHYIVLCRTFSTGTETETETFPGHYCTHFRDGSPSQGQISVPILLYFNKGIGIRLRTSAKTCIVQESVWGSVSISVSVGGNKPLGSSHTERQRTRKRKFSLLFGNFSLISSDCSLIFFTFAFAFAQCEHALICQEANLTSERVKSSVSPKERHLHQCK